MVASVRETTMTNPRVFKSTVRSLLRSATTALTFCALTIMAASAMRAQTFNVIHQFSFGPAGSNPYTGVTIDARGRLYGTTGSGGVDGYYCDYGCGVLYRLEQHGSGWIYTPLYAFRGPTGDGDGPNSRPVFAPNGSLYGTTGSGGMDFCEGPGCGIAYSARPPATACTTALCVWQESAIYSFGNDYGGPSNGALVFDAYGNIYGTAVGGGLGDTGGTVYEMTLSNGQWVYSNLYTFPFAGSDGSFPEGGVIFDRAGNLYGTTSEGGNTGCSEDRGCGTVFELSPSVSGWTETVLYAFQGGADGEGPIGGLIMDSGGNLYGTTVEGGQNGGGTVFELSPSGSNWNFNLLYSLSKTGGYPQGPTGSLAMDSAGNLYGTTANGGLYGYGAIFKLSPSAGGWTYISLHDFTYGNDGGIPIGDVTLDGNGNLYGTASNGGANGCQPVTDGCGVVWEITP
jgi:uncharacterized repeat protein (TIGR03803 family)